MAETGHLKRVDTAGNAIAVFVDPAGNERQVMVLGDSVAANVATVGSGGALLVQMSDGTNTPTVLVGDTGQNALVATGARKEVTFTTTTVQAVASTDVSNYRTVSVHVIAQGTNSTVVFQGSNDNTNWVTVPLSFANVSATTATSTTSAGVLLTGTLNFRYFRLNVTGISAGTTSGVIEFFSYYVAQTVLPVNPVQQSTGSAAITSVASSATTVSLLVSNGSRKGVIITNDGTANLFLAYASTASTTAFTVKLPPSAVWEMPPPPIYTGAISGIWDSAAGSARITELS